MSITRNKFPTYFGIGLALLAGCLPARSQAPREPGPQTQQFATALPWQTTARWRRGLLRKTSGTLVVSIAGVAFRPAHGSALNWPFEEIQTFDVSPRRLVLTSYQNRRWHLGGERKLRFDLESAMPPSVAALLARRIAKPSENGIPNPDAASLATIPARHRTFGGGTNGILRFRRAGIDYVTGSGNGARSWRWADIETLALPDPYHLSVSAYRETFAFELKQAMSPALFDWLWNQVYGRDLAGLNLGEGGGQ